MMFSILVNGQISSCLTVSKFKSKNELAVVFKKKLISDNWLFIMSLGIFIVF